VRHFTLTNRLSSFLLTPEPRAWAITGDKAELRGLWITTYRDLRPSRIIRETSSPIAWLRPTSRRLSDLHRTVNSGETILKAILDYPAGTVRDFSIISPGALCPTGCVHPPQAADARGQRDDFTLVINADSGHSRRLGDK
jgi:hypothetical protein